jgi:hypothetical protein
MQMTRGCFGCRLRPEAGPCLVLACPVHPDKSYEEQERVAIIAEGCRLTQEEAEIKRKEMRGW